MKGQKRYFIVSTYSPNPRLGRRLLLLLGLSLLVVAFIAVITSFKRCESIMVITVCLVEGNSILPVPLPPPVIICLSLPYPLESDSVASRFSFLIADKTRTVFLRIHKYFYSFFHSFSFLYFFFLISCNFKRKSRFISSHCQLNSFNITI